MPTSPPTRQSILRSGARYALKALMLSRRAWTPKNLRRPARWGGTSLSRNNPRKRDERTLTGRINPSLVLIGDDRDGCRQREHHMKVRYWKQIAPANAEPFPGGCALTLRTMAI